VRALARGQRSYAVLFAASAVFIALALLIEGSRPAARLPLEPSLPQFDKVLHFGAHFILTSLLVWSAALWPTASAARRLKSAALGGLLADLFLGVSVELTQYLFGRAYGRQFDLADVAANTVGAVVAILAFLMVVRLALRPYISERKRQAGTF
jgi:VanZ family protein